MNRQGTPRHGFIFDKNGFYFLVQSFNRKNFFSQGPQGEKGESGPIGLPGFGYKGDPGPPGEPGWPV